MIAKGPDHAVGSGVESEEMSDETREQRVRERAHAIWEREGQPDGAAERHWAMAERELQAEGVERLEAPTTLDRRASPPEPRSRAPSAPEGAKLGTC